MRHPSRTVIIVPKLMNCYARRKKSKDKENVIGPLHENASFSSFLAYC
jgi:hypothetical protein